MTLPYITTRFYHCRSILSRSFSTATFSPHYSPPHSSSFLNLPHDPILRFRHMNRSPKDSFSTSTAVHDSHPPPNDIRLTPQRIKELRTRTGAPMLECKKALLAVLSSLSDGKQNDTETTDTEFLVEKATEWLRKHGSAKAMSKLVGRETTEGLVGLFVPLYEKEMNHPHRPNHSDRKPNACACLVQVSCETDFSARSDTFIAMVEAVTRAASTLTMPIQYEKETNPGEKNIRIPFLLQTPDPSSSRVVQDILQETILSIRENIHITRVSTLPSVLPSSSSSSSSLNESILAGYIHNKMSPHTGTSAAIVQLVPHAVLSKGGTDPISIQEVGKKLAMHIVAAKPLYRSPSDIPQEVLDKEKQVLQEQFLLSQSNSTPSSTTTTSTTTTTTTKSKEIMEKVIAGKIKKFLEQVCLTEQAHLIQEGNPKVGKYIESLGWKIEAFEYCSIH